MNSQVDKDIAESSWLTMKSFPLFFLIVMILIFASLFLTAANEAESNIHSSHWLRCQDNLWPSLNWLRLIGHSLYFYVTLCQYVKGRPQCVDYVTRAYQDPRSMRLFTLT